MTRSDDVINEDGHDVIATHTRVVRGMAAAFDPTDDNQYDFSKSAAQDWWIERGATGDNPDITDVEAFANSAPWFLTNSGYATGGYNSGSNNLANPEKFARRIQFVSATLVFGLAAFDCSLAISSSHTSLGVL